MKLCWSEIAWKDYLYWQENDKKTLKKINKLIDDTKRNGTSGIGHPEPLKDDLQGLWSKQIDKANRFVFRIIDDRIEIAQCRTHYAELKK